MKISQLQYINRLKDLSLEGSLPLPPEIIEEMRFTQQNPRFHSEGSVLQHTLLVLNQFHAYAAKHQLTNEESQLFYWAAVLHDIGKPKVTKWMKGRWTSKGHEQAGVSIARNFLLQKTQIAPNLRRKILDIVRWHHIPLRFGLKNCSLRDYLLIGTRIDLRSIGLFSKFDIAGRICVNQVDVIRLIDRFNNEIVPQVEEILGTYDQLQSFYQNADLKTRTSLWNAVANEDIDTLRKIRSSIPRDKTGYSDSSHNSNHTCVLLFYPSGLSTNPYIKRHFSSAKIFPLSNISRDLHQISHIKATIAHNLTKGVSHNNHIVIDAGFISDDLRLYINQLCKSLNIKIEYHFFEATLADCLWQNACKETKLSSHEISSVYSDFLAPHPWEAHKFHWVNTSTMSLT